MRARWALLAVLALYAWVFRDAMGGPLHGLNLAIHETGHILFTPFGEIAHFLGGSLFQVAFPAVFVGYFWWRGDRFGSAVALWWVGLNFWDLAPYIADARAQQLPLVGGGVHDWTVLLGEWGLLHRDTEVARSVHLVGTVLVLGALVLGLRYSDEPDRAPIGSNGV